MTEQLTQVQAFILTGASGAGKSSVARGLEAVTDGPYRFERAKAVVTRAQRGPEDDDYEFVSDETYERLRKAGRFLLETPSYNYRGAVVPYTPPDENTYPLYILTPRNAQRLQAVLAPRPRIVHIDRSASSTVLSLQKDRPTMTPADIALRLQQGAGDRATARGIEDIGINNDGDLSETVLRLHRVLTEEVDRFRTGAGAASEL